MPAIELLCVAFALTGLVLIFTYWAYIKDDEQ